MTRLGFLVRFTRGHRLWILAGLALAMVTALANVVLLAVSGWFITGMALAGAAGASFNYFLPSAVIRGCAILRAGGRYAERLVTHEAILRLIGRTRADLFAHLSRRSPQDPVFPRGADAATRLGSDLETLQGAVLSLFSPIVVALVIALAVIVHTAGIAPPVAVVVALGLAVGGGAVPVGLAFAGRRPGREAITARAALAMGLADVVEGRDEVFAFGALARTQAALTARDAALRQARRRAAHQDSLGLALLPVTAHVTLWAVVVAGAPLVIGGTLAPDALVMLAFLGFAAFDPLSPLPQALQRVGAVTAALDRVRALAGPTPKASPPDARTEPRGEPAPIRLTRVTARWPGASRPTLEDVSLTLAPGDRLGLVGASGAGKSSIVSILAGDLRPDTGTIEGTTGLRLAVAPQTPVLLSETLRHNLTLGDPAVTEVALRDALATAGLVDWLAALPLGLDEPLGRGGRPLSGGEARRLGIARALLSPAPVLVLDEPGEGLDPAAEAAVLDRVLATAEARRQAVVLITHRPAGLDRMDTVLYLDGGRVLEAGNPWALTRTEGPFRHFLERCAV
ncbi:thiol reductant ABC exporter subunit CydC [Rhodospira trueperi]|uniref:ATP-binding cassette, subfamily C, CydC n=1 Tax=Rhodospira trueperi TaxID=69960 RepID=A0A1G7H923_9PROT|nr:thiol reductant ABC exporter subunit CydC [Rhodospira trueperi]SDE96940.1 ATP-binding cassette, subfamily C, CydC [Rhodospira trueperi]